MNTTNHTVISEGDQHMNTNRQTTIKESKMKIITPKIIRWAGLSAIVTGLIFAGIQPIHPPDVLASVNTNFWIIITSLKTVMCIFGLFGIAGLYARQVEETGWLGLSGYLLLTIFYAVQICYAFAEVFILPLLTTVAPKFVESSLAIGSGGVAEMNLGAFATVYAVVSTLYLLGLLLFGIAMFRARILSRWPACLLGTFSTDHGYAASTPDRAVSSHAHGHRSGLVGICALVGTGNKRRGTLARHQQPQLRQSAAK